MHAKTRPNKDGNNHKFVQTSRGTLLTNIIEVSLNYDPIHFVKLVKLVKNI